MIGSRGRAWHSAARSVPVRVVIGLASCIVVGCGGREREATPDSTRELTLAQRANDSALKFADTAISLVARARPTTAVVTPAPAITSRITRTPRPSVPVLAPLEPAPSQAPSAVVTAAPPVTERSAMLVPVGTIVSFVAASRQCAPDVKVGDEFTAIVDRAVERESEVLIPAGATVTLRVQRVENGEFSVLPVRVRARDGDHALSGAFGILQWDTVKAPVKKRSAIGALAGAVAAAGVAAASGQKASTTIAAGAAGAVGGAAIAAATRAQHVCLPARSRMALELDAPLRIGMP